MPGDLPGGIMGVMIVFFADVTGIRRVDILAGVPPAGIEKWIDLDDGGSRGSLAEVLAVVKNHQMARAGQAGLDPLHIVSAAHLLMAGGGIIPVLQHTRRFSLAIAGRIAEPVKKIARRTRSQRNAARRISSDERAAVINDVELAAHRTDRDLIERLKKDPKTVSIGFATALGSHNHIGAGLLMKAIGGEARALKAIAFKGSAEAITALLGGHIDLVTTAAGNVDSQVAAGKLRIIGVAASQRFPGALAGVPTRKEQGVNVVFGGWRAIVGPRGMTAAQSAWWEGALRKVVESPEWKQDLEQNYWSNDFVTGEQFRKDLAQDYGAMKSVLVDLGLAKN